MKVKLKDVRLFFAHDLWEATEFKSGDGKPRYSGTFGVEIGSENDKAIREAIDVDGREKYKDKWDKVKKNMEGSALTCCYMDGSTKNYDVPENHMVLAGHNKARPMIVGRVPHKVDDKGHPVLRADGSKEPNIITEADGILYSGCYVNAVVDMWVQQGENPGIRCTFVSLQYVRDGEFFGGGPRATADDFDNLGEDDDLV